MKATVGNVTVRYRPRKVGKYHYWEVVWYEAGSRKSKTVKTEGEAEEEARCKAEDLAEGGTVSLGYHEAKEYRWLRKEIPHAPIGEIVAAWKRAHAGILPRTVPEVIGELLLSLRAAGRGHIWQGSLATRLGGLAAALPGPIGDVTPQQIEAWFTAGSWSGRTKNNRRAAVEQLERFAKARKYLSPDAELLSLVPVSTERGGAIEIFTPNEMRLLLTAQNPKLRYYLAIAAFSGVRQAEILRLDWSAFEGGFIRVSKEIAKTGVRRLVPIAPNLALWIRGHPPVGKIWPVTPKGAAGVIHRWAKAVGCPWKRNGLRHGYCSYRLPAVNNCPQVAEESGNSVGVIRRNYLELVTPNQSREYFSIVPSRKTAAKGKQKVTAPA